MERQYLIITIICIFCSCKPLGSLYLNAKGNLSYDSGEYQKANISYQKAVENKYYNIWIAYNLGNVYHALGEFTAAEEEWKKAANSDNPSLLSKVFYNSGILLYEKGDYNSAYGFFKKALQYNSSNIDAKINLELSLKKLSVKEKKLLKQAGASLGKNKEKDMGEAGRILDYMRKKELQKYLSNQKVDNVREKNDW